MRYRKIVRLDVLEPESVMRINKRAPLKRTYASGLSQGSRSSRKLRLEPSHMRKAVSHFFLRLPLQRPRTWRCRRPLIYLSITPPWRGCFARKVSFQITAPLPRRCRSVSEESYRCLISSTYEPFRKMELPGRGRNAPRQPREVCLRSEA
jgi:hypothetical protein